MATAQYLSKREMGVDIGRATTRVHPPHPLPARPYYTTNWPTKPSIVGALVAARPCPPPHLFSLFERYWATARDRYTCPPDRILLYIAFSGRSIWRFKNSDRKGCQDNSETLEVIYIARVGVIRLSLQSK